jgi:hypothetical protein
VQKSRFNQVASKVAGIGGYCHHFGALWQYFGGEKMTVVISFCPFFVLKMINNTRGVGIREGNFAAFLQGG